MPGPKLKLGAGIAGVLPNDEGGGLAAPNEGAGVGVLVLPVPNVKGLLSGVPPKLKLGAGVDVALPPNLKPVEAGCEGVVAGNLKPVEAGCVWDPLKLKLGVLVDD